MDRDSRSHRTISTQKDLTPVVSLSRRIYSHVRRRCLGERSNHTLLTLYSRPRVEEGFLSYLTLCEDCVVRRVDVEFFDRRLSRPS